MFRDKVNDRLRSETSMSSVQDENNSMQQSVATEQTGRSEPASILRILISAHLLFPFVISFSGLLSSLVFVFLIYRGMGSQRALTAWLLVIGILTLASAIVGAVRLRNQLLRPLVRLEQSVTEVCEGAPNVHLAMENVGVLGPMVRDIDSINDELAEVYDDMQERVDRQTRRLAQQTATLKTLYDVAASINQAGNLDDLLIRFLHILKKMVNGRSATVSLITTENRIRLVGSIGLDGTFLSGRAQLPLHLCECGKTLSQGDILCEQDVQRCSQAVGRPMFSRDQVERLEVPLEYQGEQFGTYQLYVERGSLQGREELLDLLFTIGSHLGMAIAKQRLDEEAHRISIMEERTTLAHELHDSLAQTLASLRFQARMLEDTLAKSVVAEEARTDLQRISSGIDEAHTELRELLNSFLAPVEQQGLDPELKKLTRRFRQETGIPVFFQRDCPNINLTTGEEKQILRIAQECLANVRKHAGAHNVRILLTCRGSGEYRLLVEDDGIGFDDSSRTGGPGEQIGLTIMEERARRLGGDLSIESEPGEGTRVELVYNRRKQKNDLR
jgi:two-component system nitrate/nitrite sensor histidine kinase NarX